MRSADNITWCTEEEDLALCHGAKWGYYGDRRICDNPAEHYIGDAAYGRTGRFGYCDVHFRQIQSAFHFEIMTALPDGEVMHWILQRAKNEYFREADKEWWRRRADARKRFEELFSSGLHNTGVVYFIQMGDGSGPIKIGTTRNISKRLDTLSVGSPYPLRVLLLVPGSAALEGSLHELHREHRLNGEWFKPAPELLEEIERLRARVDAARGPIKAVAT